MGSHHLCRCFSPAKTTFGQKTLLEQELGCPVCGDSTGVWATPSIAQPRCHIPITQPCPVSP